jgi:O-antigen/teichoic acid export membrane protein
MKQEINLKKNVSIAVFVRILSMLIGFIVSIYITRYLGAEIKGKMSYFLTLSATIWMILDLGFHKSLSYILAKDNRKLNSIFSFSVFLHIFDIVLLIMVVTFFKDYFYQKLEITNPNYLVFFILFIAITRFGFVIKFIMLGIDKILWQNFLKILPIITYIILFFLIKLFVKVSDKYLYVLFVLILPLIFWTYYYTIKMFISKKIRLIVKFDILEIIDTYKLGIKAFLSAFFIFLLIRFDIFLIKRYTSLAELGIYSLAANFVTILQSFSNLVGSLMLPKFSSNSIDEIGNIIILRRVVLLFFLMMLMMSVIFILVGKQVIGFVYSIEFIHSYNVFCALLPAVFFLSFGSIMNTYFMSKGFPIATIIFPIIALAINVGLNIILIPSIGILGAAIATSISYGVWLFSLIIYFFNTKLVKNPKLLFWQKKDFTFFISELYKIGSRRFRCRK